tara:strand:- start:10199 stop:11002 length:804 start_codon:yes stop_codon:yes gene_type:complete
MVNINAYDEFGFILWYYAPLAYYHHINGTLGDTNSKIGSKPVFYFSNNHIENKLHNEAPFIGGRQCYNFESPIFTKKSWLPPPYKKKFKNNIFKYDKPILTINNKNNLEWDGAGIFNYFDSISLENIIKIFYETHQILYIRPPQNGDKFGYQADTKQRVVDIGDIEILKKYPNVIWIGDVLENSNKVYNEIQFMMLANSEMHISCAGDSVIPSYFGGDVLQYNCPNCQSANRGVWKTNSWLNKLSNANIYGFQSHSELLKKSIELWK